VLRELLQNAADASASKVVIKFETIPSSIVPLPPNPTSSALIKHTILHHTLKRMIVSNNGQHFGTNDWSRLKRIAEGNPDETKIGAFGVGFYSVFSDCEEPFVSSGGEAMAFYWKGNSLYTRRLQLPDSQMSKDTTFVLDYRNTTTTIPSLMPLCQFLATSLTFVGLSNIELWLDEWKLLTLNKVSAPSSDVSIPHFIDTKTNEGLMRVQSVVHETSQLDAVWLKIVGWNPKNVASSTSAAGYKNTQGSQSLRTFFSRLTSSAVNHAAEKAAKEEREAQMAISEDLLGEGRATVFLHVNTASISTSVSKNFSLELERATKKPPPRTTRLAVLTTSYDESELSQALADSASKAMDIFASVLPHKAGRIFIGFPTHQTTGLAAHISAPSVIPTVERESIDLNARWVRTWNQEMLRAAGIVSRIAWTGESQALKEKLSQTMRESNVTKVREAEIEKVTPYAVHNMNQFTFKESTPSSQVGTLVEEAFWTCDKSMSLEILSSRGVLLSRDVRLATDELSFVEGIPVVPKALSVKASAFVHRLVELGVITEVTTSDIKRELEVQALSSKQLIEFLQWLTNKMRRDEIDVAVAKSLLNVTVANDEEENKVVMLGAVRYFLTPARISTGLPVPADTIPFKFIKNIDRKLLIDLGWGDLQIYPWLKYLLGNPQLAQTENQLDGNPAFASQVLSVVSKQWDGLSQSSKTSIINLFESRTVMPTKLGMRKPSEAYFQSVKLFDDLPIITLSNVKDKFLTALGVRKTIELSLVFDRLLNVKKADAGPTWSHVELIKYLTSVRNDIPSSDIKKLQNTPICTAENDSTGKLYKLTDLFEPKDELRPLNVKFIQWPGLYRPGSEEGKFLRSLGLRTSPTVSELIDIAASAVANGDYALRDQVIRYIVNYHHQHGYSSTQIASSNIAFLPVEGENVRDSTPSGCFTNPQSAIFGCKILRRDLHPHAVKLGVRSDPPINGCIEWLIRNPPTTNSSARQIFEYFASRLNELGGEPATVVSQSLVVPIFSKSTSSSEKPHLQKMLPPTMCFLGTGGKYTDILDYVDFGDAANSFLIRCGSKSEPSSIELARLVTDEPARIFATFDNPERYQTLLTTIAEAWPILKKDKNLVREMKGSSFLLASVEHPITKPKSSKTEGSLEEDDDDDHNSVKSWQLAKSNEIVVVDDPVDYNIFKSDVLAAPQEEELEKFYLALGASPISEMIQQSQRIGERTREQNSAVRMKKLVNERIKLFFSDISKERIKRDSSWIEKNLSFVAVSSISIHKTLKSNRARFSMPINAVQDYQASLGHVIFFKPGSSDLYHLSLALCQICLNKTKPQQAIVLTTLLESDLNTLQARGYNIARILNRRQAEHRIQEEEKRKRLEEEQLRIQQAKATRAAQQDSRPSTSDGKSQSLMPGVFPPDTPDHNTDHSSIGGQDNSIGQPIFSQFRDRFRGLLGQSNNTFTESQHSLVRSPQSDVGNQEPLARPPRIPQPESEPNAMASPEELQRHLRNAIQATRPYNQQNLNSAPVTDAVQETQTFCDRKPAQNIVLVTEVGSGMKVFCSRKLQDVNRFLAANLGGITSFSSVILDIAGVMGLRQETLHIFYDEDSTTIAFNSNGALFMNYRYFSALHLPDAQQGRVNEAITYWFVTICHELAHNICEDHGSRHSYWW
jgi:hypothetical protein